MQPSDAQVERSITALQTAAASGRTTLIRPPVHATDLPAGLADRLSSAPVIRLDRVAAARARLAQGATPTAEDVAGKLVGRLVCDRLR
jgi:hypothetical protein